MELLRQRILKDGEYLGNGILKVDSFMNHQIDPVLMREMGAELARRFKELHPTRILTAETSGIAPALSCGMALAIPVVFARKHQPVTMKDPFKMRAPSHTYGRDIELMVSSEYLQKDDRVLVIDDFLATAKTILALVKLVEQSESVLVGVGAVIEKTFEGGRDALSALGVPIESLAKIKSFQGEKIELA